MAQGLMSPTRSREDVGLIPGLPQRVKDPALLWLWCRPAAVARILPLAWERPHAEGMALKTTNQKKKSQKSIMVVARGYRGGGNGELLFHGCGVSVFQDEKSSGGG